jgi:uncharacterized protein
MASQAATPARGTPGGPPPGLAPRSLLALLFISSCAFGPRDTPRPVRSLAESRHAGVVMQEWDLSCGAAAIATLLSHDLADPVSEREAAEAMLRRTDPIKVRVQGGFSLLDLQEFAEARGYEANGYGELTLGDLLAMAPAIVPVRFHGFDHFVVVRGVRGRDVVLADPAFGRRSMRMSRFERAWRRKVAFVVEGVADAERPASGRDGPGPTRPREETEGALEADETTPALERALVREGAAVLPPMAVEVEPELGYVYRESGGRRRDTVTPALDLRLGLPWAAQADVRLPYVAFDRQPGARASSGLGDAVLGLTKLLAYERRALPELLLTARWKTTTGRSGGGSPTGSGADAVQALVTALKRTPPVVLLGSVYYVVNLPSEGVDVGDAAGVVLTTLLAATPDVSLLLGIDVATFSPTTVRGRSVPGTDRLGGIVNIGLATVLSRTVGANVTAGIGITPAAPPFQLTVALPLRL